MPVASSPFVPGYGALPPYLAGRHDEQKELRRLLAYLEDSRGAPREAQNLGHEVGHALLNASQSVAAASPFLLVMAGTPELQAHLNTLFATFWSRAEQIGIGRLSEDAGATS